MAGTRAVQAVTANPEKSDRAIAEEIGVGKSTVQRARKSTVPHGPVDEKRTGKDGKKRRQPTKSRQKNPRTDQVNEMVHRPTEFTQRYIEQLDAWLDGGPHLTEEAVVTLSNALHLCAEEFERMAKFVKAHPTKGDH